MNVAEAIEARRAIRRYTDAPVPRADIERIVQLAGRAPSAWNVQPWRIVAVVDPEVKAKLQVAAFNQPQVGAAPVVFVVASDMADAVANAPEVAHPGMPQERRDQLVASIHRTFDENPDRERWGAGQTYIALGFLLLAAQSLGYATSPMLGFDPAKVKELLGLPEHATIPAIVAMGVAAEEGFSTHRHPVERILRIV